MITVNDIQHHTYYRSKKDGRGFLVVDYPCSKLYTDFILLEFGKRTVIKINQDEMVRLVNIGALELFTPTIK